MTDTGDSGDKLQRGSWALLWQQWRTLFKKRWINTKRDWMVAVTQTVLPAAFAILALVLARYGPEATPAEPVLGMHPEWAPGLTTYGQPVSTHEGKSRTLDVA